MCGAGVKLHLVTCVEASPTNGNENDENEATLKTPKASRHSQVFTKCHNTFIKKR